MFAGLIRCINEPTERFGNKIRSDLLLRYLVRKNAECPRQGADAPHRRPKSQIRGINLAIGTFSESLLKFRPRKKFFVNYKLLRFIFFPDFHMFFRFRGFAVFFDVLYLSCFFNDLQFFWHCFD